MPNFDPDRPMYRWRRLSSEQREAMLKYRRQHQLPLHSPPHYASDNGLYLITAACYEHRPIIGQTPRRMAEFERELLEATRTFCREIFGWIILPNHYHLLVHAPDVHALLTGLGRLHGRMSYRWNGEEGRRGRKVWCYAVETAMKSERHFWASLNYVLHNAVHHGYVERWTEWPYSNAKEYLATVGRDEATRTWQRYPILDYGKNWDPPES